MKEMSEQKLQPYLNFFNAKWHILIGALCGIIIAFILLISLQPEYRAEMVVAPTQKTSGGPLSSLLPSTNVTALQFFTKQISQLSSEEFLTFENTLLSSRVAKVLLDDTVIMNHIDLPQKRVTDMRDYLARKVKIYPVGSTPLRRVFYHHSDPDFAQNFLSKIYEISDDLIKTDAKARNQAMLKHLDKALRQTRNPDHRHALVALLKEQQHSALMSAIDMPFAAQLVDPPIATPKPVRPDPYLLYPALLLLGAFLGYLMAYIKHSHA